MISDIVFEWNTLTITLVVSVLCVSLAVAVDFGPELYREKKARDRLIKTMAMIAERKNRPDYDPSKFFELGVFVIQPEPVQKRRHAKV